MKKCLVVLSLLLIVSAGVANAAPVQPFPASGTYGSLTEEESALVIKGYASLSYETDLCSRPGYTYSRTWLKNSEGEFVRIVWVEAPNKERCGGVPD